jgi:hypothetical protein
MALLTLVVAVHMLAMRIAEIRRRSLRLPQLATSVELAQLECVRVADNFRNLFETPVLFYVVCILAIVVGIASKAFVALAWIYVALRCAHSVIHCTYNHVRHRFYAFGASLAVLVAMWVTLAVAIS